MNLSEKVVKTRISRKEKRDEVSPRGLLVEVNDSQFAEHKEIKKKDGLEIPRLKKEKRKEGKRKIERESKVEATEEPEDIKRIDKSISGGDVATIKRNDSIAEEMNDTMQTSKSKGEKQNEVLESEETKLEGRVDKLVAKFLLGLGLEKYINTFETEEIDFVALKLMKNEQFKELGIPMGPRTKILHALETGWEDEAYPIKEALKGTEEELLKEEIELNDKQAIGTDREQQQKEAEKKENTEDCNEDASTPEVDSKAQCVLEEKQEEGDIVQNEVDNVDSNRSIEKEERNVPELNENVKDEKQDEKQAEVKNAENDDTVPSTPVNRNDGAIIAKPSLKVEQELRQSHGFIERVKEDQNATVKKKELSTAELGIQKGHIKQLRAR